MDLFHFWHNDGGATLAYIKTSKQFMARLKEARIDQGLTQAGLGERVGMSQKKIAMIENLTVSPRLDVLLVIVSALGLDLSLKQDCQSDGDNKENKEIDLVWE